jgi:hypothetical protein
MRHSTGRFRWALLHPGVGTNLRAPGGQSRTAYQDFLSLWKDADPDIPVLIVDRNDRFSADC